MALTRLGTKAVENSLTNIVDQGTEGTKVATGTTAQRGSTAGQLRFNTTTGLAEYYTGTAFKSIDSPPVVSSVGNSNITQTEIDSGYDLTITGSSFSSGATVKFIGADNTEYTSPTVTVNSNTSITARVHSSVSNANEPYGVKVTNTSGLSNTLGSAFNVDGKPAWSTASGSLGTFDEQSSVSASATATDPESDTITYSETGGTVLSTNGLSLNSSTGAITGTAPSVANDTTLSFTLRATSGTQTADRAFSMVIADNPYAGADGLFGFNNNTTNNGAGTYTSGVSATNTTFVTSPKKFGTHSLQLNGNSAYVDVTTNNNIKTIVFWLYWEGYAYSRSYIIDGRKDANTKGYWTWDNNGNSVLNFNGSSESSFSWSPTTNTWYHCAITLGSTNYVYIDGTQKLSSTDTNNFIDTSGIVIGTYFNQRGSPGSNYWLDGHIDNLALFTSQLSSSDITALYNSTKDI